VAPTPSLTIVKKMQYRNFSDEEWSNSYHFAGGTPSDSAAWKTFADLVIAQEKTCYKTYCSVVRAYGHEAGNPTSVWGYNYETGSGAVPGTLIPGSTYYPFAGDQAGVIEWETADFTSGARPRRIWLRKFMHAGALEADAQGDTLHPDCADAYDAYGAAWVAGIGGYTIAGPNGAAGTSPKHLTYVTTRTLKRRGRRP
jgi:hypothetical protein